LPIRAAVVWLDQMQRQPDIVDGLSSLARRAVDEGCELNQFMEAAWDAYVAARPGLREHLEDLKVLAGIEEMRRRGLVPEA
jgi:hypothetical protein